MENSCGAITHVLVNDPTTGYAVFGDIMIKQTRQTNWNLAFRREEVF